LQTTDGQFEQSGQELFAIGVLRPSGIVTLQHEYTMETIIYR